MAFYANLAELLRQALGADTAANFAGTPVQVRSIDGFVNVSSLARAGGKKFKDYMKTNPTKEFLGVLKEEIQGGAEFTLDIVTKCNTNHGPQYWAHPMVAIDVASWLSPRLKVQFLSWIFLLLSKGQVSLDTPASLCDVHAQLIKDIETLRAELDTKDMEIASHKRTTALLERKVKRYALSCFSYAPGRRHPKMLAKCLEFKTTSAYIAYSKAMSQLRVVKFRAQKTGKIKLL